MGPSGLLVPPGTSAKKTKAPDTWSAKALAWGTIFAALISIAALVVSFMSARQSSDERLSEYADNVSWWIAGDMGSHCAPI
jgi:hypothetical protein